jgi:hypothetical protein
MKKLILIFIYFISFGVAAQGNLQFNQVINLKSGDSYQVPANKVLKIESISILSNNLCMPRTGILDDCGTGKIVGQYNGFTYLTIGDLIYSVPSRSGRDLYANQTGICGDSRDTNPPCFPVTNIDLGTVNVPIWLRAQKQIVINSSSINVGISAIEFNIVN